MRLALSAICICLVYLAGCASLDKRMSTFVGQSRHQLISNWGPPSEEIPLESGGSRLVYVEELPLVNPSQYVNPSLRICQKVFVTDSLGIIESYSHNNCGEY